MIDTLFKMTSYPFVEVGNRYGEDFYPLENLYVDDHSVLVGYKGTFYGISIRTIPVHTHSSPYIECTSLASIQIYDLINHKMLGIEKIFSGNFNNLGDLDTLRTEIKKAIIEVNIKPTDFYK